MLLRSVGPLRHLLLARGPRATPQEHLLVFGRVREAIARSEKKKEKEAGGEKGGSGGGNRGVSKMAWCTHSIWLMAARIWTMGFNFFFSWMSCILNH